MDRTCWAGILLVATLASGCGLRDEMTTASSLALTASPSSDMALPDPPYTYEPLPWATDDVPVATDDLNLPGLPEATPSPAASPSAEPTPVQTASPDATASVPPVPVVEPTPQPVPTAVPKPVVTPAPLPTPVPVVPAPAELTFTTKRTWTTGFSLFGTLRAHTELQVWNQSFFGTRQAIVTVAFTRKGAVVETREYTVTVPPADVRLYTFDSEEAADDVILSTRGVN
jgi:hypothetical protein